MKLQNINPRSGAGPGHYIYWASGTSEKKYVGLVQQWCLRKMLQPRYSQESANYAHRLWACTAEKRGAESRHDGVVHPSRRKRAILYSPWNIVILP